MAHSPGFAVSVANPADPWLVAVHGVVAACRLGLVGAAAGASLAVPVFAVSPVAPGVR